jgi:1-acyl-sn-glycerol-3-phosphate acyltransferase
MLGHDRRPLAQGHGVGERAFGLVDPPAGAGAITDVTGAFRTTLCGARSVGYARRVSEATAGRRPTLEEIARTAFVAVADVAPLLARLAVARVLPVPSTGTPRGLAALRANARAMLAHLSLNLEVVGAERAPRDGALLFMWNQESHLDHLVLGASMPRPFFSLINNELARFPFYGAYMRASGHVHVDRNDEVQWRGAIAQAAARVRAGDCFLISPEGTRSSDGRLLPMKRGAFILATTARCPIVCATVIGGHERLARGRAIVQKGKIRVVFSDPIPSSDDAESLARAVATTFAASKLEGRRGQSA